MTKNSTQHDETIQEDYDQWHRDMKNSREVVSPLEFSWYDSVYRQIKDLPGGKVLEVGCGRGEFAVWLAKVAPRFKITGLDFSQAAIDIALEHASESGVDVSFVQGDAEALPFPADTFDLVISCECMEHVPHPKIMATEIARVAKKSARFCLTTENYFNGMTIARLRCWILGKAFDSGSGVQPRENFYFFWMVRNYLQDAGMTVDDMESCHYQWLLLPGVDPAKLCTTQFSNPFWRKIAFPFGRHFSFFGYKR